MSFASPSHTFGSTNPEQLSTTDDTPYAAVCIIGRATNASPFQYGGPEVTNTVGGYRVIQDGTFWIAIPGRSVKLTEMYAAGANGDVVDLICIRANSILQQA